MVDMGICSVVPLPLTDVSRNGDATSPNDVFDSTVTRYLQIVNELGNSLIWSEVCGYVERCYNSESIRIVVALSRGMSRVAYPTIA